MVPKWIGQWMMGYIHTFKTGSWSADILDGELTEIAEPWKVNTLCSPTSTTLPMSLTHLMGWIIWFKKPQGVAEG